MSTKAAKPTIEDSIKTALDAADMAITVTREFDKVGSDYAKTRVEVKAVNRQILIVFISSLVASVLAVAAAGLIYFRTMSEMQTTNATSLEALVIFAENVDRLAAATTEANSQVERIEGLVTAIAAVQTQMDALRMALDGQGETTADDLAEMQTEITNLVDQEMSAIVREISDTIVAEQAALAAQIETLRPEPPTEDGTAGGGQATTPSAFDEIKEMLETMMLLQREISAKITLASTPARPPARAAAPTRPAPRVAPNSSDIIKFP